MTPDHVRYDHTITWQGQSEARLPHTASALAVWDIRAEGRTLKDSCNCNYTQRMQAQCTAAGQMGSTYHLGWVPDTQPVHARSNKKTITVKTAPSFASEFTSSPYLSGTHIWTDQTWGEFGHETLTKIINKKCKSTFWWHNNYVVCSIQTDCTLIVPWEQLDPGDLGKIGLQKPRKQQALIQCLTH